MYFSELKYLLYPEFGETKDELITSHIFRRVIVREDLIPDSSNYYEYTVQENETLESIADKLYGNPYYYWVILFLNNIFDPRWEFPLTSDTFHSYIRNKYGTIEDSQNISDPYTANYTSSDLSLTVTTSSNHNMLNGRKVYLDFGYGYSQNGVYTISYVSNVSFSVTLSSPVIPVSGTVEISPPFVRYYIRNFEEDSDFYLTDKTTFDLINLASLKRKVSAYDEEIILNDNKRIIKVLRSDLLFDFVNSFREKLS